MSDPIADIRTAVDFFSLTRAELSELLAERFALPAYRADQLYQWVYQRREQDFDRMSSIGKAVRPLLSSALCFSPVQTRARPISSDGTRKYLFELDQGDMVESVMIKQPKRMTLCVSSQVGCAMMCAFCRTGTMGLKRHLTASEIVRQIVAVIDDAKNFDDMFQNVVFMGMGEPLHNYAELVRALKILRDGSGLNLSGRRITISTSGLVPQIIRFGQEGLDVNLAVSLNATTDEVRSVVMPVNKRYPLETLLAALRDFPLKRRKRITIEYVMLGGVNDTDADLRRLPKLLHGIPCKINLIPYNENAGLGFSTPDRSQIVTWHESLLAKGIETTIRWSKGVDIDAACGQLASESRQRRGKSGAQLGVVTE